MSQAGEKQIPSACVHFPSLAAWTARLLTWLLYPGGGEAAGEVGKERDTAVWQGARALHCSLDGLRTTHTGSFLRPVSLLLLLL